MYPTVLALIYRSPTTQDEFTDADLIDVEESEMEMQLGR